MKKPRGATAGPPERRRNMDFLRTRAIKIGVILLVSRAPEKHLIDTFELNSGTGHNVAPSPTCSANVLKTLLPQA